MSTILLNPGPVTLSEPVRNALLRPDLCHREPEFATLQSGLRAKLLRVYDLDPEIWASILLTGSGTAAVEAMIGSLVPAQHQLLVVENGAYGERMSRIATAHGVPFVRASAAWGEPLPLSEIERQLAGNEAISHVAVVHHETTTGRLNEIERLTGICQAANAQLLIDGVSSFGAESIDFPASPVDACAATANKCLHGVPGTAFVILRRSALAAAAPARSVYLNLADYLDKQDQDGTPFTQSVQTFYALDAALDELFDAGGWPARRQLYRERLAAVRTTLLELGVRPLLPDNECSCVLHAFELPAGTDYEHLHDALKDRGFVIYAGQGNLATRIFRISTMGEIGAPDIQRLNSAFREILRPS